jgi:hypothetical protein
MSKLRTILSAICFVASFEARADISACSQSDPVGLEILKELPAKFAPRRDEVLAVIGRRSSAEALACAKKLEGIRKPRPWAWITIYSKPTQAIPGLCRLSTARYSLSNGTWAQELDRGEPGYAVALTLRNCERIDAATATAVLSTVEDFTLLRILRYSIESGPLHKAPNAIGFEWREDRVYFALHYRQTGCSTRVLMVGGTTDGGFEVAEESLIVC